MKFATRFDLGDTVQYSHADSKDVQKGIIRGIQIEALAEDYDVYYLVKFSGEKEVVWSIGEENLSAVDGG